METPHLVSHCQLVCETRLSSIVIASKKCFLRMIQYKFRLNSLLRISSIALSSKYYTFEVIE